MRDLDLFMNIFSMILGKQYNVLAYLPETVLVTDETGRIYYANKSAFSLFGTSKLKGRNINDFFIVNSSHILNPQNTGTKQILKLVSEEKTTKITDVKVTDVSSGKKKRYILSVIDNTQDHSLLDELIAEKQAHKVLNHTKNVLLTKMSNYTASPLNSVAGFSRAMLDGLSGEINEKQRKYLEIINTNSSEVLLFINKLTELSKVEADIVEPEYGNFDVVALASVISNETAVKLQNKDIKFEVRTEDLSRQNCYCDKSILSAIITNLIDNAISMTETGSVTLKVSNPLPEQIWAKGFNTDKKISEKSYLSVELTCQGIDTVPYSNEDVFDPYVQADKNSKKYLLQSLLLCTAKKFAEKLNGILEINNNTATCVSFLFIIPADKEAVEIQG